MTESRSDNLCECRAQRAGRIRTAAGQLDLGAADTRGVAEFVNHGTLLCQQEQQPDAKWFEQMPHPKQRRYPRVIAKR